MTTTAPAATRMAPVVWALGLTQIVGYGTLYYSFSTLAPQMARSFGWTEEWVYGALSASLLLGGLIAPLAGSAADRFGAARVMSVGSIGAALALVATALAPERLSFLVGLAGMEVASAFVLYSTAFAALAQINPLGAQRSITLLTLIAGFASTLFWPLTALLNGALGWREVYLVFAALNLLVCLPVHGWLGRVSRRQRASGPDGRATEVPPQIDGARAGRAQLVMLLAFALLGFVSSSILVHMVPMLAALGLGGSGVLVTTLFGPAQVLARLVNMRFGRGLSQPALAVIAAAAMPLGLALLALSAPSAPGAALFAILFGLGSGLSSIVSGTLPLVLFGTAGYGRRLGLISSARLVVSSVAPFVFALATALVSPRLSVAMVAGVGIASTLCFAALWASARAVAPEGK